MGLFRNMLRASAAMLWEHRFDLLDKVASKAAKRYVHPHLKMHRGSPFITVRAFKTLKPVWKREIHAPQEGLKPLPAIKKPITTRYVIQRHFAKRAGEHFDLRLMINGRGISFAIPKHRMPKNGENLLAVLQPDHIEEYFDFEGEIPEFTEAGTGWFGGILKLLGFNVGELVRNKGAGLVEIFAAGEADVISCDSGKVVFELPDGPAAGRYVMINTEGGPRGDHWILRSFPPVVAQATKPQVRLLGKRSEDYSSKAVKAFEDGLLMEEKVDGACAGWQVDKDGRVELTSPRLSKTTGGVIRYTHKLPKLRADLQSAGLRSQSGEGELWHRKGPNFVAAVLNSNPTRARFLQRKHGPLRLKLYNITEEQPYAERYQRLKQISNAAGPTVDYMRQCKPKTPAQAVAFATWCRTDPKSPRDGFVGKTGESVEIDWVKGKPTDAVDVPIVGFKEGTGKYAGTLGSLQVSRGSSHSVTLGTGFTDIQRDWIWTHRDELEGEIVKARFHERANTDLTDTGGRFEGFHESKSEAGLLMYAEALADGDDNTTPQSMVYRLKSARGWRRG